MAQTATGLRISGAWPRLMYLLLALVVIIPAVTCVEKKAMPDIEDAEYDFGPNFQGCYEDDDNNPDLSSDRMDMYEMTMPKCSSWCKERGAKYMGVQNGDICSCGEHFGKYGKGMDYDCMAPCPGNLREMCGGTKFNAIYST